MAFYLCGGVGGSQPGPTPQIGELVALGSQLTILSQSNESVRSIASFTVSEDVEDSIIVGTGFTDCGGNEGYLTILVNNESVMTIPLTTDTTISINEELGQLNVNDVIDIKTGFINSHSCSWKVSVSCVGISS